MGFFDKVKEFAGDAANTISDTAKDVSNGAKEFTDKSKYKRDIKNEEARMNIFYTNIGRKFYEANPAAPAGFEQEYENIAAAKNEIARLQKELDKIESASKCPGCGAKISSSQKFCQVCGKNL